MSWTGSPTALPWRTSPQDTWTRARRSVVRDRAASVAAAAAVVGIVVVGVTWLPRQLEPPVAKTDADAIPSRIWTLHDDVDLPYDSVARVGPLSAAYFRDSDETNKPDEIIVVSAEDGTTGRCGSTQQTTRTR